MTHEASHSDLAQPPLHVKSGQTKTLPARTYTFSNIEIESGGILNIQENSRQWLILHCEGDLNLQGKIIFRNFYSTTQPIQATSPDGKVLNHKFEMTNLGGDGGDGNSKGIGNRGGRGTHGTEAYGGGGGGGGFNGHGGMTPGGDATTWRGGSSGGHKPDGDGGDGATRRQSGNGGLMYIYVGGTFNGTDGTIDLSGSDGDAGKNGGSGTGGGAIGTAAAGGGGGAPGGEGGYLALKLLNTSGELLTVNVAGGVGGAGGSGSEHGTRGGDGLQGFIDYL